MFTQKNMKQKITMNKCMTGIRTVKNRNRQGAQRTASDANDVAALHVPFIERR